VDRDGQINYEEMVRLMCKWSLTTADYL